MRKMLLLLILLLPVLTWSKVLYVSPSGTDTSNCDVQGSPCASFQYAIGRYDSQFSADLLLEVVFSAGAYSSCATSLFQQRAENISRTLTFTGAGMDSTFITCGTNYTSSELSLLTITHNNTLFTMTDLTINDTLGTVVRHDTTFGAGVSINLVRVAIRNCSSVTSEYGVIAAITGAFSSNTFSNPFVLNVIDSIITSNTFTKHPVITLTSTCRLQVTLRNSTFSDNSVENNNGGVLELSLSTVGSSLCAERPSISILNSNFLRNSAKYIQTQDGGFGFGSGSGSSTAITTGRGGSIYFTSTFNNIVPPPIISIANTTCSGGVAQESGSFFYSLSSTDIRIQNSVFTSNSAGRSSGSSFFGSSESTGNGGVFYTGDTSSITFSSSICSQNTALLAGGCFYSGTLSNFSAFASTFELNSARTGGAFDSGSVLFTKISNVIFRRNSASSEGGALRIAGVSGYCSLRLSLGNFSSNSADRAGSLYVDSCSADISDSVFSDEKSSNFAGGSMYSASTDLNLRNCVFLRCSSERSGGGALYAASGFKQTNISSSSFVGCSCSQSGSAIYIDLNHKAFIWDSLISGNTVIGFGGPGGALFVTGSTSAINLYRSNVTLNTAAMNGGGVHVNANSFFTAENCNFVSNSASGAYGGGIYADQLSNAVIRNSLFLSNFAYLQGGAMYAAAKSKFEVYGSTIQSSIATKGAALYLTAGSSGDPMHYFFNCTFRDHNDDRILYGGAIYALTGLLLEETRVVSNIASEQGGAIYSDSYNVTLFKSEISSNSVSSLGGGIYLLGGQFFLNRATVGSNYARLSGGGIYVKQRANLTLVDSSISNNNGARSGGGIFMEAAQLSITGSLVERNTANQGGGVYTSVNSSVSVDSSRFVGNIGGTGGAFYSLGWPGSFRNSNFTENAARDKSGSCGTAIGTGGSIYVDYFDCSSTNLSVLIDSVFMRNNTAVKFGAGISFSTIVDVSKRCNYSFFASLFSFSSNQANYGSNVSTGLRAMVPSFTSITVWSADTDNSLGLRMYDHFGFGVVGDTCDINIVILNSTNRGLLQFGLPMPYRTILNANNLIKYFFVFGASEYPQVDLPVNLSLKVTVLSQVSYLNTTVNLCRSGQKFQKDSIRFWACADCISGTRVSRYFNECIECSAGYYSFSRSTSCSGCIPGTSSSSASPRCVACPEGKYSDKPLQANCVDCPSGKYGVQGGNGSFCYDCPFNAITISAGCPSITSCICSKGSFGAPYLNKPCKSCPLQNGVTCNDDSPLPFVAAGYWRDPEDEAHILDCIPSSACQQAGFSNITVCAEGHTGRICGQCIPYQYFKLEKTCRKCNSAPAFMWVLLITIIFIFLLIAFRLSQKVGRIPYDARIGIAWMQIISLYTRVSVSWPDEVLFFLRISSFFNFEFELFSPACAVKIDYWSYYHMQMAAPLIFIVVLCMWLGFSDYRYKKRHTIDNEDDKKIAANRPDLISRTIYVLVFILSNMYTFLATKVLGPLECYRQPDRTFTMTLSPSDNCYEGRWADSYPSVVFYAFLYLGLSPFLILISFIKNRRNITEKKFLWRFGALVRPYKPQLYYWELVATLKKIIFVVLVKILADISVYGRLFYLICFLILFMGIENVVQPYRNAQLNGLNSFWNIVAVFLLLANALIFEPGTTKKGGQIVVAIFVILFLLFAIFSSFVRGLLNVAFNLKLGIENFRSNDTQETRPRADTDLDDEDRWQGPKINLGLEMFNMDLRGGAVRDPSMDRSSERNQGETNAAATVVATSVEILPDNLVETNAEVGGGVEMYPVEKVKNIRKSLADDD